MNDEKFKYKYTALNSEDKKEVASIQSQYENLEENKDLIRLRKLDHRVKNIPTMISIAIGILGLSSFGIGMAATLEWAFYSLGIPLCFIGFILMGLAYFVYKPIMNILKRKYKDEILDLSNKLLNQ